MSIKFELQKNLKMDCSMQSMEIQEPPLGLRMKAEIMSTNEETFKLIQTL